MNEFVELTIYVKAKNSIKYRIKQYQLFFLFFYIWDDESNIEKRKNIAC